MEDEGGVVQWGAGGQGESGRSAVDMVDELLPGVRGGVRPADNVRPVCDQVAESLTDHGFGFGCGEVGLGVGRVARVV